MHLPNMAFPLRLAFALLPAAILNACSDSPATPSNPAMAAAGASGSMGTGNAGSSGSATGGANAASAGSNNNAAGASGSGAAVAGGQAGAGGQGPGTAGAVSGGAAGAAGLGGVAGAAGAGGAAHTFTCNQVTAMTLTREWFQAGFESNAGISNSRWQLKAREHGYITEWANPNSDFWNQQPESPCAAGSTNPDHVVLTVLSWNPACCTTQPEWETPIEAAVSNLVAKYSALKRIDLMTVIRGPNNQLCPTPPVANETIALPAELDAALAAVASKHPGLVYVAPKFEAPNCAAFSGGGPHLTQQGNATVAQTIATHFGDLQ